MGVLIISGCPRSGTSLTMHVMAEALGESRIIGGLFGKNQTPAMRDLNPDGFRECAWTVNGIREGVGSEDLWNAIDDRKVVKIVSRGLAVSDPAHIDRIVYLNRDPREVAKSQERLRRVIGGVESGLVVHSPDMYIRSHLAAARWMIENAPDVYVLDYADLLTDAPDTLARLSDWLGEDVTPGASCVKPSLHRSKPQPIEDDQWEDAEAVYAMVAAADWQGIVDRFSSGDTVTERASRRWICERLAQVVSARQCEVCVSVSAVHRNFRATAEGRGIDWHNLPCAWECGANPDAEPVPVELSIARSHWLREGETRESIQGSSGIGRRLHSIIVQRTGARPCDECREVIAWLNGHSAEQVRARRAEIVAGIVQRAQSDAPKWWQRWGATLAPDAAAVQIGKWLNEAIETPKPAAEPRDP